ncbi:MAG: hypothetical protein IJ168_10395, partial [Eubacterium sp.]|nr:hypothetical protein [Eubacterium sp.]
MKKILIMLITAVLLLVSTTPITAQAASRPTADELDVLDVYGYCNYQEAFKCLDCINQYRADYGRQPLVMDKTLMEIAMCRAAECAVDYSHGRPNGKHIDELVTGETSIVYDGVEYDILVFDRSKYYGNYTGNNYGGFSGENLVSGCFDGKTAALSWYNSSGHRNNFLQSAKSTGVGCFEGVGFSVYIQIFCTYEAEQVITASDCSVEPVLRTIKVEACNVDGNLFARKYILFTDIMDVEYSQEQYSGDANYCVGDKDKLVLRIRDNIEGYDTLIIDPSKVSYSTSEPSKVSIDENGVFTVLVNENTTATMFTEYQGRKYPVTISIKKTDSVKPQQDPETPPADNDDSGDSEDDILQPVAPTLLNGWQRFGDTWYFYDYGRALTGWKYINGHWYFMNSSGAMQTGWQWVNGRWYFMNGSGAMQTGWQWVNGRWYFMNGSGAMQTGWQWVNGR